MLYAHHRLLLLEEIPDVFCYLAEFLAWTVVSGEAVTSSRMAESDGVTKAETQEDGGQQINSEQAEHEQPEEQQYTEARISGGPPQTPRMV